ncbi:hypothetical protein FBQ82_16875 [Anaerolineae bacterium CFX7]|nr:hypothetical protein [Anaerolineae bacterium CFX7]
MDSSMIGKIEKARRYASEASERIAFDSFQAEIKGDNDAHTVAYTRGAWQCGCHYFATHRWCSHTKAMEYLLDGMIDQAELLPNAA